MVLSMLIAPLSTWSTPFQELYIWKEVALLYRTPMHSLVLHRWSSGRILPCHGRDPGSIPGRCIGQYVANLFAAHQHRFCSVRHNQWCSRPVHIIYLYYIYIQLKLTKLRYNTSINLLFVCVSRPWHYFWGQNRMIGTIPKQVRGFRKKSLIVYTICINLSVCLSVFYLSHQRTPGTTSSLCWSRSELLSRNSPCVLLIPKFPSTVKPISLRSWCVYY